MKTQKKSLLKFYSSTSYILITLLTLLLSTSFFVLFKETNHQLISQKRAVTNQLLLESVRAPVQQGSYFEATQRLIKAAALGQIKCFIFQEPFIYNGCLNFKIKKLIRYQESNVFRNSDGSFTLKVAFFFSDEENLLKPWYFILMSFILLSLSSGIVFLILSSQKRKIFSDFNSLYQINRMNIQNLPPEFVFREFEEVGNQLRKLAEEKIRNEKEIAILSLATQVAHDIRSPLEVLKSLTDELSSLPDASQKRVQMSILRIEEITFNLLKTHKQAIGLETNARSEELLGHLLSVVTEKNIEYRNQLGIEIIGKFDTSSFGLFSRIQRSALKSIISNLINNSIEAMDRNSGIIEISLVSEIEKNMIKIFDNGPGLSTELRSNVFTKGFTTKKTGNGIGLFNAKQDIEAVGGTIDFESEIGKGTLFIITLPKSESPSSFLSSIDVYKYDRIIVLDDDPAFHEVWNKRLEGLESEVEHIHSVEDMLTKYQVLHPKILLLTDFELMDKQYDGIDTILKLGHAEHSVLVTARNEEQAIQDRCHAAGIKLLPKSLVNYVKIVGDFSWFVDETGSFGSAGEAYGLYIEGGQVRSGDTEISSFNTPIILIDDDKLVQLNWKIFCDKNHHSFQGFISIADFLAVSDNFDKAVKIYIDSNLGDGIKGEIESEKIFNQGFKNLYLTTGYEKGSIEKPHWIKDVFSKRPENIGQ